MSTQVSWGVRVLRVACYVAGGLAALLLAAILVLLAFRGHPEGLVAVVVGAAVPYPVWLCSYLFSRRDRPWALGRRVLVWLVPTVVVGVVLWVVWGAAAGAIGSIVTLEILAVLLLYGYDPGARRVADGPVTQPGESRASTASARWTPN